MVIKDKKELIYNSGVKLFGKFGVKRVSVDMIVENAGVAKGTFYIYFKNKGELYEKIIDDFLENGKLYMSKLYEDIPDIKERFFSHLLLAVDFFQKNIFIKNIITGNNDYCLGKINPDYLFSKHLEIMKILFGKELENDDKMINIARIKGFFLEILNYKKHFDDKAEFEKFILNLAAIITNGLFSDYESLIKGRTYPEIQKL